MTTTETPYTVCIYLNGSLRRESDHATRDHAELWAADGIRARCEVTIYYRGRALRDWNRRTAGIDTSIAR